MLKEEVIIKFNNREILEKTTCKFGNSSHVLVSKKYLGKKAKIITGKSKVVGKKIIIDFSESEILERKVTGYGTGCHVIIPKEHVNKKVKILWEKNE